MSRAMNRAQKIQDIQDIPFDKIDLNEKSFPPPNPYRAWSLVINRSPFKFSMGECEFILLDETKKDGEGGNRPVNKNLASVRVILPPSQEGVIDAFEKMRYAACVASIKRRHAKDIGFCKTPEDMIKSKIIETSVFRPLDEDTGEPVQGSNASVFLRGFLSSSNPLEFVRLRKINGQTLTERIDPSVIRGRRCRGVIQCTSGRFTDQGKHCRIKHTVNRVYVTEIDVEEAESLADDNLAGIIDNLVDEKVPEAGSEEAKGDEAESEEETEQTESVVEQPKGAVEQPETTTEEDPEFDYLNHLVAAE